MSHSNSPTTPNRRTIAGHASRSHDKPRSIEPVEPKRIVEVLVVLKPEHFGSKAALDAIRAFATEHNLTSHGAPQEHGVDLIGEARFVEKAFGVELLEDADKTLHFEHQPSVPDEIHDYVQAVLGLTTKPVAKPHFHFHRDGRPTPNLNVTDILKQIAQDVEKELEQYLSSLHPKAFGSFPAGSFTPIDLAKIYNLPAADGTGQAVGIIELGGGIFNSDLSAYFSALGISGKPNVFYTSVAGGKNAPGFSDADGECILDVDVVAGLVPRSAIVVYFTTNTDRGFLQAIQTAASDPRKLSSLSISWGSAEENWDAATLQAFNNAFQQAVNNGVTVFAAAGDNGASDDPDSINVARVDFPASSPYVVACGGTKLTAKNGARTQEVAWNELAKGEGATGGGISDVFQVPLYQSSLSLPSSISKPTFKGRAVPDVSAIADPETGYAVVYRGQKTAIGGTSGAAPFWAGIAARLSQLLNKRLGYLHPVLYANPTKLFFDITTGDDITSPGIGFSTRPGYDCVTGLGVPNGTQMVPVLKSYAIPLNSKSIVKPVKF